jgi:polyisoprenoid-binding protein YceI
MMRKVLGLIVASALMAPVLAEDVKYGLNGDNTKIEFTGAKTGKKHEGGFKTLTGTATVSNNDPTAIKVEVEIDMNSTYTDTEKLTNHLKSPDFFGVKANPKSKFVSTKVEKAKEGYKVTGDLTLNGKTKTISFPAQVTAKDGELTVTAEFPINRHDWGISYGKGMIFDEVALKVKVTAKK